jgi:CheY-like chemotaxis protein
LAYVLIIDDDPVFAELTSRRLMTGGHRVDVRHEANGALVAEVRRAQYDVVLVDVVMPGISGPTMVDALGASPLGRPALLFFSSADVSELANLAVTHGADGWISKSATRVDLLERVELALKRRSNPP